ncbi:MAG: hypothetical protein D6693_00475 [Planctomycetota bacterium]|nr:MAG: hypothetical protein D6693_00475 [Planctomycetota bacterium]
MQREWDTIAGGDAVSGRRSGVGRVAIRRLAMLVITAGAIGGVGIVVDRFVMGESMDEAVRTGASSAAVILGTLVAAGVGADGCCGLRRR